MYVSSLQRFPIAVAHYNPLGHLPKPIWWSRINDCWENRLASNTARSRFYFFSFRKHRPRSAINQLFSNQLINFNITCPFHQTHISTVPCVKWVNCFIKSYSLFFKVSIQTVSHESNNYDVAFLRLWTPNSTLSFTTKH